MGASSLGDAQCRMCVSALTAVVPLIDYTHVPVPVSSALGPVQSSSFSVVSGVDQSPASPSTLSSK